MIRDLYCIKHGRMELSLGGLHPAHVIPGTGDFCDFPEGWATCPPPEIKATDPEDSEWEFDETPLMPSDQSPVIEWQSLFDEDEPGVDWEDLGGDEDGVDGDEWQGF